VIELDDLHCDFMEMICHDRIRMAKVGKALLLKVTIPANRYRTSEI